MKELIKKIKVDFLLSSVLGILLGIILMIWGIHMLLLLGRLIGVILIFIGVSNLLNFLMKTMTNTLTGIAGGAIALIGLWILLRPETVVSIIPIVIGVILIFHGIKSLTYSLESRQYGNIRWGIGVFLGVISILLGVYCIIGAFGIMKVATTLLGVSLIYSGISNIWVAFRATKAEKAYHRDLETIDVEFKD